MKANELMIGDWVLDKKTNRPYKIIGTNDLLFHDDYSHIPLTAEILEKNGFGKSVSPPGIHAKCYEINNKDEKYCLTIADYNKYKRLLLNIDSEDSECFNIRCDYVHQLQHALRLCNIEKEIIV